MNRNNFLYQFGLALVPLSLAVSAASAADTFSNSLTGFTGDSTQLATQAALAADGFNFSDTTGETAVQFDTNGATFDFAFLAEEGRNYLRTNDTDYANHSFVAEITIVTAFIDEQDAYFGLGSGTANPDFFRTPDFASPAASVMYWGENESDEPTIELYAFDNTQTSDSVIIDPATGLDSGTLRVRLAYDWYAKAAVFSFDLNYAGGAFAADLTSSPVDVLPLYGADGWPVEPARIFFGGDETALFKDFSVNVTTPALIMGDFNASGTVTEADWAILRANQHSDLVGKSAAQAYVLGDMNGDGANNHADFALFKVFFDDANGSGSFDRMVAGVPEPSSLALLLTAGLLALGARRRTP